MGLDDLQPANTKRARATAMKVFARFLSAERVDHAYVCECIGSDTSGQVFVSVMDKYGMYLVFNESKAGKQLTRNTCMQYYRQVKLWLLDMFPGHRVALDQRLLKMGKTMESFCLKREGGGIVKKAIACTKSDLRGMMLHLYANARMASDCQDACLLALLWHLFGRASDVAHLRKQNLSIDASGVYFVRFVRVKTSEEHGLSLYPGSDYITCPLVALACALATQSSPSSHLLAGLPAVPPSTQPALVDEPPLAELLEIPSDAAPALQPIAAIAAPTPAPLAIHSHVNRLLSRVAEPAAVKESLTSHSFRCGGAQHANACADLADRWIFDRGAWNMSTTNKAFNYVFNTRKEDHKVVKVLSGWRPDDDIPLPSVAHLDELMREHIAAVQARLFASCGDMATARYCVSTRVLEALMSALMLHFPAIKAAHPDSLIVRKLEQSAQDAQLSLSDVLAWSSAIAARPVHHAHTQEQQQQLDSKAARTEEQKLIKHQETVIEHLLLITRRQEARLDALEVRVDGSSLGTAKTTGDSAPKRPLGDASRAPMPAVKRQRSPTKSLSATWFEWYCSEPRLWRTCERQRKSDIKLVVVYMKLFISSMAFDDSVTTYRDDVMAAGIEAERHVLAFFEERAIHARGALSLLKHLRSVHKIGSLDHLIARHKRLLDTGEFVDPAPAYTQDILELTQTE